MDGEITRQSFIDAFTQRPDGTGPMPTEELLRRLDITAGALKDAQERNDKRIQVVAANCLRGALIRLAQAYGDASVTEKVNALVAATADITGI